uniref:Uncharacterized protein n=1 Tax=Graphocephala atropunctata TaxID=36148 RepID=A0A1B6KM90_9HEMI
MDHDYLDDNELEHLLDNDFSGDSDSDEDPYEGLASDSEENTPDQSSVVDTPAPEPDEVGQGHAPDPVPRRLHAQPAAAFKIDNLKWKTYFETPNDRKSVRKYSRISTHIPA